MKPNIIPEPCSKEQIPMSSADPPRTEMSSLHTGMLMGLQILCTFLGKGMEARFTNFLTLNSSTPVSLKPAPAQSATCHCRITNMLRVFSQEGSLEQGFSACGSQPLWGRVVETIEKQMFTLCLIK